MKHTKTISRLLLFVLAILLVSFAFSFNNEIDNTRRFVGTAIPGLIRFSAPVVIIDSKGKQYIANETINSRKDIINQKMPIMQGFGFDLKDLYRCSEDDSISIMRFKNPAAHSTYIIWMEIDDMPLYNGPSDFWGWDASFSVSLVPLWNNIKLRGTPMRDIIGLLKWRLALIYTGEMHFKNSLPENIQVKKLSLDYRDSSYRIKVYDDFYLVPDCYWNSEDSINFYPIRIKLEEPVKEAYIGKDVLNYNVSRLLNVEDYTYSLNLDIISHGHYKGILSGKLISKKSRQR